MNKKEHILICANHGGFGGSFNLNIAINKYSELYYSDLVVRKQSPYSFGDGISIRRHFTEVDELFNKVSKIFIVDYQGLATIAAYLSRKFGKKISHGFNDKKSMDFIFGWLKSKSVIFFWTGSRYRKNYKVVNRWVQELGCKRTFAMLDLLRLDLKAFPLYQTFDFSPVKNNYYDFPLKICHSPGLKYKGKFGFAKGKGSHVIEKVFEDLKKKINIDYEILKGISFLEAIEIKKRSHLFVDQFMPDVGGMGKSALEAIMLGIPTLGNIHYCQFIKPYEDCPVINFSTDEELYNTIYDLYLHREKLEDLHKKCSSWGRILNYQNTVEYLDRTIKWAVL